jgi:hypothetical protein
MTKRELLVLLRRLLEAIVEAEAPTPRPVPPPAPAPRRVILTEAEMARGFIPYEAPRQWTVDARWVLDRQREPWSWGSRSNRRKIYGKQDYREIPVDGYTGFYQ